MKSWRRIWFTALPALAVLATGCAGSSRNPDLRGLYDRAATLDSPVDWTQITFLYTDHLGLTRDPAFTDNVLYLLLEDPR